MITTKQKVVRLLVNFVTGYTFSDRKYTEIEYTKLKTKVVNLIESDIDSEDMLAFHEYLWECGILAWKGTKLKEHLTEFYQSVLVGIEENLSLEEAQKVTDEYGQK